MTATDCDNPRNGGILWVEKRFLSVTAFAGWFRPAANGVLAWAIGFPFEAQVRMRFRVSDKTPVYLSRRFQLRLMSILVGCAALVLLLPSLWTKPDEVKPAAAEPNAAIDYSVQLDEAPPLSNDEFRLAPEEAGDSAPPPAVTERTGGDAYLNPALLSNVRDNTLGIRHDEAEAYYQILRQLRETPGTILERAARTDLLYVNLMTDSENLRGELTSIVGDLRRLSRLPPSPPDTYDGPLYEGWVFTADSGTHPYRVVTTSLPENLVPAESMKVPVRVTGYFFKREGYETEAGLHVAPTLLAKRIQYHRTPRTPPPDAGIVPYMLGVVGAVTLALLVTLASFVISDQRSMAKDFRRFQLGTSEGLDQLPGERPMSIEESLRHLANGSTSGPVASTTDEAPSEQDLAEMEGGN